MDHEDRVNFKSMEVTLCKCPVNSTGESDFTL